MKLDMYKQSIELLNIKPDNHLTKLLEQYVPDVNVFHNSSGSSSSFKIIFNEGMPKYLSTPKNVFYQSKKINNFDVMALVSRQAEYLWSKKKVFSVHSSAVTIDNKTLLIPGRSGSGKTTLMMELVKNFPNAKIISGDRTIIENGNTIVGGTKILNFVPSSFKEEFPDIYNQIKSYAVNGSIKIYPDNSPFNYQTNSVSVDAIIFPNKHPGSFTGKQLTGNNKLTKLVNQSYYFLEEFPRILLGIDKIITTPSTEDEKNCLFKEIKKLSENTPVYSVSGKLNDSLKFIKREIL